MIEKRVPNPLTCNGCSKPLPDSHGTLAWLKGFLKCRDCARRDRPGMTS